MNWLDAELHANSTTVQHKSSARSMLWQLQCACSSSTMWFVLLLFRGEIRQIINLGKRKSFLVHVLAQLHLHVNSSVVRNSMYMLVQSIGNIFCKATISVACCLSKLIQSTPITTTEIQVKEGYPVENAFEFKPNSI